MLHRQGHSAKVAHARGNGRAGGMASASPLPSPPLSPLPAAASTFNGTAWVELFPELNYDLTVLWTLLCGFLVVFMQCGFAVSWAGGQAGGRAGRHSGTRDGGARESFDDVHGMACEGGVAKLQEHTGQRAGSVRHMSARGFAVGVQATQQATKMAPPLPAGRQPGRPDCDVCDGGAQWRHAHLHVVRHRWAVWGRVGPSSGHCAATVAGQGVG